MVDSLETLCRGLFRLGEMPSPGLLKRLSEDGYLRWVNVCGLDLQRIYPSQVLDRFRLDTFFFSDIFSPDEVIADPLLAERVDETVFISRTTDHERQQFLAAVQLLVADATSLEPTYVFCYRGQGRSPAVLLATLGQLFQLPPLKLVELVQSLRPQSQLTRMSLSALVWSQKCLH